MHSLFISYSTKDQTTANALCSALESAGIRCWMAPRNIAPGAIWSESIIEAIQQASIFLVVMSPYSNQSDDVLRELQQAASAKKAIIPFVIAEFQISNKMRYFTDNVQHLKGSPVPAPLELEQIVQRVRELSPHAQATEAAPVSSTQAPELAKGKRRLWPWLAAAVIVIALGAAVLYAMQDRSPESAGPLSSAMSGPQASPSQAEALPEAGQGPLSPQQSMEQFFQLLAEGRFGDAYDRFIVPEGMPRDRFIEQHTLGISNGTTITGFTATDSSYIAYDETKVKASLIVQSDHNGTPQGEKETLLLVKVDDHWKIDFRGVMKEVEIGTMTFDDNTEWRNVRFQYHVENGYKFIFDWVNRRTDREIRLGSISNNALIVMQTSDGQYTHTLNRADSIRADSYWKDFWFGFPNAHGDVVGIEISGLTLDIDVQRRLSSKELPAAKIDFIREGENR